MVTTDPAHGVFVLTKATNTYMTSALNGVLVATVFAYGVLLISTANWILATIAILTLISVVVSVIGMMVVLGWTLGVLEAICATLVVGFSADFLVHYANSYVENSMVRRRDKVAIALMEMGVSITAAAGTTLGAALFLFLTVTSRPSLTPEPSGRHQLFQCLFLTCRWEACSSSRQAQSALIHNHVQ